MKKLFILGTFLFISSIPMVSCITSILLPVNNKSLSFHCQQITDNEQAFSFTGSLYQKSYAFCKINIPISVFIIPSTFVQIFFTS